MKFGKSFRRHLKKNAVIMLAAVLIFSLLTPGMVLAVEGEGVPQQNTETLISTPSDAMPSENKGDGQDDTASPSDAMYDEDGFLLDGAVINDGEKLNEEEILENEEALLKNEEVLRDGLVSGALPFGEEVFEIDSVPMPEKEGVDLSELDTKTSDELLMEYFEHAVSSGGKRRLLKAPRSNGLTGNDLEYYNLLKPEIAAVAAGTRNKTQFVIPVTDLDPSFGDPILDTSLDLEGPCYTYENDEWIKQEENYNEAIDKIYEMIDFDLHKIFITLRADCPYELYWNASRIDAPIMPSLGINLSYDGNTVTTKFTFKANEKFNSNGAPVVVFPFVLSRDFRSDSTDPYTADTTKTSAASNAASNAQEVVSTYANETDYDKLLSYKNWICGQVDYDHEAAQNVNNPDYYKSPWQLIHVFDRNPDTNVVCEGYSKAFQYLCNMSSFSTSVECIRPTGTMKASSESTPEPHMWNIVKMGDGKNYLVDVTNCDEGSIGSPNDLFMQGYDQKLYDSNNKVVGYVVNVERSVTYPIQYVYDTDTIALYAAETELALSDHDYDPTQPLPVQTGGVMNYASLTLAGDIGVNFYITIPQSVTIDGTDTPLSENDVFVRFLYHDKTQDVFAAGRCDDPENHIYKFTYNVAAKEMREDIGVTLFFNSDDGAVQLPLSTSTGENISEETGYQYAVKDYLEQASQYQLDEKLENLLNAIDVYGKESQLYFGYNAGELSPEVFSDINADTLQNYRSSRTGTLPAGLAYDSSSLLLKSETILRHYYVLEDGYNIDDFTFSVGDETLTPVGSGSKYYVQITGIAAQELDRKFPLKVTSKTVSTDDPYIFRCSALSYCYAMLGYYSNDQTQKQLCNALWALYRYNLAAEEYY